MIFSVILIISIITCICLHSLLFMQGPGATSWELDEVRSSALWCDFVENCEQQTCSLLLWHRTYSTWLYKPVAHVTWIMQTPVHDARTYCPSCVTAGGYLYSHGHAVLLYMYHLTCCSCMSSITFLNRNEITVQEETAEIMISSHTMWLSESHSEGRSAYIEIIAMIYTIQW